MKSWSWEQILSKVEADDQNKWDCEDVAAGLVAYGDNESSVKLITEANAKELDMTDHAFAQVCGRLKIPPRYLRRVESRLQAECLNFDLKQVADDKKFLLRCKGNLLRGFLSDKYSKIENRDVLDIFQEISQSMSHQVRSFHLDDRGCWMKILVNDLRKWDPSNKSKELFVGLLLGNSEVGARSVSVEPFVYRLACTNDMVIQTESVIRERHMYLTPAELKIRVAKGLNAALETGGEVLDRFIGAHQEKVEKPGEVIMRIARQRGISQKMTDQIRLSYEEEPEPTRFGVINAFTRAAQTLETDARVEMERLAGHLLEDRMAA